MFGCGLWVFIVVSDITLHYITVFGCGLWVFIVVFDITLKYITLCLVAACDK